MMDVKEKLVELIDDMQRSGTGYFGSAIENKKIADYLIANGVTVQEWVSVKDRLPEVGGYVVCIATRNPFSRLMPMVAKIEKNGWVNPITEQYISEATHWMPMPTPTKREKTEE